LLPFRLLIFWLAFVESGVNSVPPELLFLELMRPRRRWRAERTFATGTLAHGIKRAVGTIDFHLMHDAQQLAEPPFWEGALLCKPSKILGRQVVDRKSARWEMLRTKFAERHVRPLDVGEISSDPVAELRLVHAARYLSASSRTLISRKVIESP
jgi:hypothetical protein